MSKVKKSLFVSHFIGHIATETVHWYLNTNRKQLPLFFFSFNLFAFPHKLIPDPSHGPDDLRVVGFVFEILS